MAIQYVMADEKNFSLGIDARSAENQIAPGFVRDLLNADVVEMRVRKRPGYQGYAGNLPVRVTAFEYRSSTQQMYLTLDSAISLEDRLSSMAAAATSPRADPSRQLETRPAITQHLWSLSARP